MIELIRKEMDETVPLNTSSKKIQLLLSSNKLLKENNVFQALEEKEQDHFYEPNESDDTVIHYEENKFRYRISLDLGLDVEKDNQTSTFDDTTEILDGITKSDMDVRSFLDVYIESIQNYKDEIQNEVRSLFEEFKFDIVSDYLSSKENNKSSTNLTTLNSGSRMSLQLLKTPYPLLLHSLRPQLTSFSIICFLRKHFRCIKRINTIKLMILSISILNMSNNAILGIKFYAQMMVNRVKNLIKHLMKLERYFASCNISIGRNTMKRKSFKNSKLNIITSSMHFLISVIVKRIGQIIDLGVNMTALWKYLVVYGLEDDSEEIKVVRNIVKNPSSCSCAWYNEPSRILRTLKYVKKVLICVTMSTMEYENGYEAPNNCESSNVFMKKFWTKFGIDETALERKHLMFSTRILGIANQLSEFNTFIEQFEVEVVDYKLLDSFENITEEELEVVNERNEDERIRELSKLVEQLSLKLDLIELGINQDNGIVELKDDVNELVLYYNEVSSGNSASSMSRNMELKRLRMSEVLFDDCDSSENKQKRRSSGINFNIVSVVKNDESLVIHEDKSHTQDGEFREALEKLCLSKSNRHKSNELETLTAVHLVDESEEFLRFREELKARLRQEQSDRCQNLL